MNLKRYIITVLFVLWLLAVAVFASSIGLIEREGGLSIRQIVVLTGWTVGTIVYGCLFAMFKPESKRKR
jgi:hypothetical protein